MRRRRLGPKVDWKISIPIELALNIEQLFITPEAPKPDYGARSALVTQLLTDYWANLPATIRAKAIGAGAT